MKKINKLKLFFLLGLVVIVGFIFARLLIFYQSQSHASLDKVTISYSPKTLTLNQNEEGNIQVNLSASNQKKISGVQLVFSFSSLLEYVGFETAPAEYFTDKLITETVVDSSGKTNLRLVLITKKAQADLLSNLRLNIKVKAKAGRDTVPFGLIKEQTQIVGPTEQNYFEVQEGNGPVIIGIGGPPVSITPPEETPTVTPPPGSESIKLNLKLKFQGIAKEPTKKTLPVKITIKRGLTTVAEKVVNFSHQLIDDQLSIWQATPSFDLVPGGNYNFLIKGPMHTQKKICDEKPEEAVGAEGTYRCSDKRLTIDKDKTFDFSGITLLVGDLPEQNGVVNSYDIGLVRNNLGKTDKEALSLADVNYDGRVNSQDYGLVMFALSIRTDEE